MPGKYTIIIKININYVNYEKRSLINLKNKRTGIMLLVFIIVKWSEGREEKRG